MGLELSKFMLKIRKKTENEWVHFCYVPFSTREAFYAKVSVKGWLNNEWVRHWAKNDFGLKTIDTVNGLVELKQAIKDWASEKYPEIYEKNYDGALDKQGWIRVWVTQHMEEEIENGWKPKN